jgi:hypothetical protein
MKAPFVVPTSIVTPSWPIAIALRLLDHALSYHVLRACDGRFGLVRTVPIWRNTHDAIENLHNSGNIEQLRSDFYRARLWTSDGA